MDACCGLLGAERNQCEPINRQSCGSRRSQSLRVVVCNIKGVVSIHGDATTGLMYGATDGSHSDYEKFFAEYCC